MAPTDFSALLERRIAKTLQTLDSKGKEYSTSDDKLHNFKKAGVLNEEHPAKALHGMLTKHLVSYLDMLRDIQSGKKFTQEYIDEKFGDIINYFILQEAIFTELGLSV